MAHEICNAIDRMERREPVSCNEKCKNWKFPHRDTACVLSDVYSVKKGEQCFIYNEVNNSEG